MVLGLVPLVDDRCFEFLVEGEAVGEGVDDAFEGLWVVLGRNHLLVVANQVVVQLESSWFLLLDHHVSDLEEKLWHF